MSGMIMGSPPVRTMWVAGYLATASRICGTLSVSPSGFHEAYGVSHQVQRRLQPEARMKVEGTPVSLPSPWREKKSSEIFMVLNHRGIESFKCGNDHSSNHSMPR